MSVEVWSLALNARIGNPARKAVLLGLANHGHPDGTHVFPSVKRLAVYAELGESTVRAKLRELRDDKVITIVKKASRYQPTEYAINLELLESLRNPVLDEIKQPSRSQRSDARPPATSVQASSSQHQTSSKTTSRPPGAGGEPLINHHKEPSEEPSLSYRGKQTLQGELENFFSELTDLPKPKRDNGRQRREAKVRWWDPLWEMLDLVEWDIATAKQGLILILKDMDESKFDYDSPASFVRKYRSLIAKAKRGIVHRKGEPRGYQGLRDWMRKSVEVSGE